MEVGAGAFTTPEEGVVVDEFARLGVLAVALRLGAEGADHLTVAVVAAFADVDVASLQFQRGIGFTAAIVGTLLSTMTVGTISTSPPIRTTMVEPHQQLYGAALDPAVPVLAFVPCGAGLPGAALLRFVWRIRIAAAWPS